MRGLIEMRVKRAFDWSASALALFALSPLLVAISLVNWVAMGRPILFRQRRLGVGGRPFVMLKFRTMNNSRDADGRLLSDSARLTSLGAFLRSTSLDELPELVNVLRGDMSLVGPRPLLTQYLSRYSSAQARRMEVPPGITGWAQVKGRNALSWDERFALDVWYVDNRSFWLDLKILFMTVGIVLRRSGISGEGHATMPEFMGSNLPPAGGRE